MSSAGDRRTDQLKAPFYDAGVAVVDGVGYLVGATNLYILSIDGDELVSFQTQPLPKEMQVRRGVKDF